MSHTWDILGLGGVAVDELLFVDAYPAADAKTAVLRRQLMSGGLAGTALVAAARLGARCAYAGVLGDDDLSQFALRRLAEEQIDISLAGQRPGVRPIRSVVIVDEQRQTRNLFFDNEGVVGASTDSPAEEAIRSVGALLVDHYGVNGMIRAATIARAANVPVVADFELAVHPRFDALVGLVDHLILSRAFVAVLTGSDDPSSALKSLWSDQRQVLAITDGKQGVWYRLAGKPEQTGHLAAFVVPTVDTTGCGDVFHGAYATALVEGLAPLERLRFASAAAALKAARGGGQLGAPTRQELDQFLAEQTA
ncbi:MAG: hypothetical protein K8T25_12720 [Planctomycetia bacterium]|nr:hypothetical protein [Planctomycetia bacterium]